MYVQRIFPPLNLVVFYWKQVLLFAVYSATIVALYEYLEWEWLMIPWIPITLIGTAVAFYLGFKNNSAYDRTWEARKIWGVVPFTVLTGYIFWLMESVGDYAENPFEALAFDIPMTSLVRTIEIDLREMLEETNLPLAIGPKDNFVV